MRTGPCIVALVARMRISWTSLLQIEIVLFVVGLLGFDEEETKGNRVNKDGKLKNPDEGSALFVPAISPYLLILSSISEKVVLELKMALSFGILTGLVPGESPCLTKLSTTQSLTKPRSLRLLTLATASKPAEASSEIKKVREPRGIMKPRRVSPEMQDFLGGVSEIPRTQALKHIWAYIKMQNLQDPENRKIIICDEKLKKIFAGRDSVGFLEIAGLLNPHFPK